MTSQLQLQDNPPPQCELSPSPREEQVEPYSSDVYSDPHPSLGMRGGSTSRKPAKQSCAGGTSLGANYKQRVASTNSSSSSSGLSSARGHVYADVMMKDGIQRNALIERPQYKLSPNRSLK